MITYVIETAEGEDCSLFYCETEQTPDGPWYRRALTLTDDDEACSKALRTVSGSKTARHPRDW